VTDDVVNISFDLNCTSQGGPVNEMLWLYQDEPVYHANHFPTLENAKIGLYYNSISVQRRQTGLYTCRITDAMNETINRTRHDVKGKMVNTLL
jgi:hypothetical protein